ncbi:fibrinogen related protein 12.1, partial [Elysia marginata]
LDLTLTRGIPAITGTRKMCGVVTCSKGTEASRANNDTTSSTVVFDTILSMSLFKKVSDAANTRDVLVASVTLHEPSLMRVANVSSHLNTAGDSLTYHNGYQFTTVDRANDSYDSGNCAKFHGVGWWFSSCDKSNLNGNWGIKDDSGVEWFALTGYDSASYTEMKIRQV